jgi:heme oxygenase
VARGARHNPRPVGARLGAGLLAMTRREARRRLTLVVACLCVLAPATAAADWSGDGQPDVLAVHPDGRLLMYRTNGAGAFVPGGGVAIGSGWSAFTAVLAPGDFSGDGKPDLLARDTAGALLMYRGDGDGGFLTGAGEQIGSGWQPFTALLTPGDFSGDGKPDLLARTEAGALLLYRGNGTGRFAAPLAQQVGSGWESFTALFGAGDFSGDGKPDVLARRPDGGLLLYRGNGAAGWVTGSGEQVGSGWESFTALFGGGDFSGDGKPDVLARAADGALLLYRGDGAGGWVTGIAEPVGSGWGSLGALLLLGGPAATPPPGAPAPPAPPSSAPVPAGRVQLSAGLDCTPPGGRLKLRLRVRRRAGRAQPHVVRVVFFLRHGPRRVDRKRPYTARLRIRRAAGARGRVYARVYFRRAGSKRLRHKTVWRRFVVCA